MRFDLHVHTLLSPCSALPVEDILSHARSRGLDGVCVTDHGTMDIRHTIREGVQPNGLCVVFGMEYTTPQGDFLIFGPFETLKSGMSASELLPLVRRCDGVAVAAHPFRQVRPVQEAVLQESLCCHVEGINGRNNELENLRVAEWRQRYEFTEVGGSDAHTLEELGRVNTCFDVSIASREDLIRALRQGACRCEWNPAWSGFASHVFSA